MPQSKDPSWVGAQNGNMFISPPFSRRSHRFIARLNHFTPKILLRIGQNHFVAITRSSRQSEWPDSGTPSAQRCEPGTEQWERAEGSSPC